MRQVGLLPSERDARRFLAYLITQDIEATCEREEKENSWAVWIHDEDHLAQAKQLLEDYRHNPDDPRYQDAQRLATQRLQEALAKREEAQKNVVQMSGKWRSGAGAGGVSRNSPIVFALIAISVLVAAFTQLADGETTGAYEALAFAAPQSVADKLNPDVDHSPLRDIKKGQVWRLVTPIFLHFGMMHLLFNCYAMYILAGQIEERRGAYFFTALLLVSAIVSNLLQALTSGPEFGGLSGVFYAAFGYIWVAIMYGNRERYLITQGTIFFCLGWLVLCILRDLPATASTVEFIIPNHVANAAHVVGLLVGMAFAGAFARRA